jgi:hypothetical protein
MPTFNPFASAQALRALQLQNQAVPGSAFNFDENEDPAVQLYGLQNQMKDELLRRGSAAAGTGDQAGLARLKALLGGVENDIEGGTIAQQIPQVEANRTALEGARRQGFVGDNALGQQGIYQRNLATEKMRQPQAIARENIQGDLERQKLANQGQIELANVYGENQRQLAAESPNQIRSVGPRSMSFAVPNQSQTAGNITPLLQTVTTARNNLAAAKNAPQGPMGDFWGTQASKVKTAEETLQQALGAVFGRLGGDPELQNMATEIAQDPELNQLNIEQLWAHPKAQQTWDLNQITPQERAQLNSLLNYVRGLAGGGGF